MPVPQATPPAREALPRRELLAHVTALMRTRAGCEKVRVLGVTSLEAADTAGCNWSFALVLDPAGVLPEVYSLAYAWAIVAARNAWNLQ